MSYSQALTLFPLLIIPIRFPLLSYSYVLFPKDDTHTPQALHLPLNCKVRLIILFYYINRYYIPYGDILYFTTFSLALSALTTYKIFYSFFKIIIPRITIPDKYIRMYKLINILYKNTIFNRYAIHTNINATLSVINIIYISQYAFSLLGHKKIICLYTY